MVGYIATGYTEDRRGNTLTQDNINKYLNGYYIWKRSDALKVLVTIMILVIAVVLAAPPPDGGDTAALLAGTDIGD